MHQVKRTSLIPRTSMNATVRRGLGYWTKHMQEELDYMKTNIAVYSASEVADMQIAKEWIESLPRLCEKKR